MKLLSLYFLLTVNFDKLYDTDFIIHAFFVLVLSGIYSVIKSWHFHSWNIPMLIMKMLETYMRNLDP